MTDIVERLRQGAGQNDPVDIARAELWMNEAADEIERLQGLLKSTVDASNAEIEKLEAEIERWRAQCEARGQWGVDLAKAEVEIERLRRALKEIADGYTDPSYVVVRDHARRALALPDSA